MTELKRIEESHQTEQRSMGTTLAAAAVTGLTAGTANATAQHLIGKLTADKPKDEQPKK